MGEYTVREEGGIAVLQMDDGKANALTLAEFNSLGAALEKIRKSPAAAVVLTGRAGYFTAGLNLKVMPTLSPRELAAMIERFGEVSTDLFTFEKPIVAAVSGHALGAGAIFAFASDVRLFAEGPFKFGLNEVPAGLFVPTFGVELARAAVPVEHQTELILHGRVISPTEAKQMRIAESLHAPEQLFAAAMARAQQLAELGGDGYAATKRNLRGVAARHVRDRILIEVEQLGRALGSGKKS